MFDDFITQIQSDELASMMGYGEGNFDEEE